MADSGAVESKHHFTVELDEWDLRQLVCDSATTVETDEFVARVEPPAEKRADGRLDMGRAILHALASMEEK